MILSHTTGHEEDKKSGWPRSVPWEEPGPRRFWSSLWATTAWCLRHPLSFFETVATSQDRWPALGHAMVMHVVGFSCAGLWSVLLCALLLPWVGEDPGGGVLCGGRPWELWLVRVALAPLWVLVAVWTGSEMMHGWLSLLRGTSRPRSVTHRAVAYCYCTVILGVLPLVGLRLSWLVAAAWQVMALQRVHQTRWWKAVVAVLLAWGLPLGLLLGPLLASP